jgi:hypothetical protein
MESAKSRFRETLAPYQAEIMIGSHHTVGRRSSGGYGCCRRIPWVKAAGHTRGRLLAAAAREPFKLGEPELPPLRGGGPGGGIRPPCLVGVDARTVGERHAVAWGGGAPEPLQFSQGVYLNPGSWAWMPPSCRDRSRQAVAEARAPPRRVRAPARATAAPPERECRAGDARDRPTEQAEGQRGPPSASAAGEGDRRGVARTACSVLVSRGRDAPAAAHSTAARRGPPPARLGRATARVTLGARDGEARRERHARGRGIRHGQRPRAQISAREGWKDCVACPDVGQAPTGGPVCSDRKEHRSARVARSFGPRSITGRTERAGGSGAWAGSDSESADSEGERDRP